ncbi:unnamed protein product [Acanthoscelides obtectus]|uniref:Uncharacterized protein n=1 Tax=Acanthoscelides obtectus TaxID=200917 RepID=A0A9P0L1F5_ACAOB|nr:unnamed protein product [Acanthoscelides obtectus]CAK1673107.1 hypothetical protein AOBTE_LOCUS29241 [Acanthoscelides obtectus]
MANSDWENRRPLTQRELQNEVDNVWQNEDEADSDEDLFGELSDRDEDYIDEQQSDTDNEQSDDGDEVVLQNPGISSRNTASIMGKNGHRWSTKIPERRGRTTRDNIVLHMPGPKQQARLVRSPIEAWELLFNQ